MTAHHSTHSLAISTRILLLLVAGCVLAGPRAGAQELVCPATGETELISGLQLPLGIARSNQFNLLVSETGTPAPNTGRISIVGLDGNRRTLLDGVPSGINDVGEPSGPAGLFMRGRTLYVAIGVGDVGLPQILPPPLPPVVVPNPTPTSPIFSSVLAIHFSAAVEKRTDAVTLTLADQRALAEGETVTLGSGKDTVTIRLIADFPNFTPNPLPFFPGNIRLSNPFGIIAVDDQLYVTDGGRNLVWQVDIATGAFSVLATFPPIPNPVAPFGPPVLDAVPTGIAYADNQLLVTLFRGFPFPPGTSVVEQIDPLTGAHAPLITGLKTIIGVLPTSEQGDRDYLVLQHVSGPPGPPAMAGSGILFHVEAPGTAPELIACLGRPTSMTLDEKTGILYVAELETGRIVAIPVRQ
jgi:hypothetical protein